MMDRIGNLEQKRGRYASEATGIKNSRIVFAGIVFVILLMSNIATATSVTYYLNATGGVNIGADGTTNVTGSNQAIPPIITALLDKNNLNNNNARSNDHPAGLYNHSRWYFTLDYPVQTQINSNPAGKAVLRGSSTNDNVTAKLYDYDPLTGSKNLIGSSLPIRLNHSPTWEEYTYPYTVSSPAYIVPRDHRLMLQFDFTQNNHGSNARIYANSSNSYITVIETPITYNVTINATPSSANITAGANFTYNITVNNTGSANGNYSLNVSDSDTTNFLPSIPGMTTLSVPAGGSNQTTITITANSTAQKDAVDTTTITAASIENPIFGNITQITTKVSAPSFLNCAECHESYLVSVNGSKHNQTKNPAAPACTSCHEGYESQHSGFIVNESNTCRNCHLQNESGFYERHTGSSDCTSCHFANTTRAFDKNASLFTHDHNLTVEHNFYEYNQSGMPVRTNGGTGPGMFPYYTCTLTCHYYNATSGVEGKVDEAATSWLGSSHARSLQLSGDNKMSCSRCKSPSNYNVSANQSSLIDPADWQGIQCRTCHNLHDMKFPNNTGPGGFPVAFYNGTLSSLAGFAIYDKVNSSTDLCEKCHSGSSHDSKFAGTHKDTAGFNCTNCHMNSSFNTELHKFQVKNTTSNVTGCEVCHEPEDHTWAQTSIHYDKVDCVSCHDRTVSRNSTGFAVSPDNNYGIYNDTTSNKWATYKISHGSAAAWPLHNISRSINCNKCHGTASAFNGTIAPLLPDSEICAGCHLDYSNSVLSTNHNTSINVNAPECTTCHTGYEPVSGHTSGNKGYIVNESNTCRNCHTDGVNGFYERHSGSSDCTSCHFANSTRPFEKNSSLFSHDHNLAVEHNYYEYNQSGMPVRTNNGTGIGMFPYYTCTLTCHKYNATSGVEGKIDEAAISWLSSAHARSLHMSGDNKMSCAKCKAPANYNASANQFSLIGQPDWQGIQCRVCHNLHDRKFPNNTGTSGFPVAFYNGTLSSLAGYAIYDKVNSSTELCEKCHFGSSHDSRFAGTHKDSANFTCTNCHMNTSFNNELHKFEVRNTTSNITGCEVCHDPQDHTWPETARHKDKADCVGCHDQTISRNATGYAASEDNNYVLCKDTITSNWTTCKISHGSAATWPLHNISKNVKCEKCHGAISVYSGIVVQDLSCSACHATYESAINSSIHNQSLNPGAPNCTMCHTGYQPVQGHTTGTRGYIVNESNTCRNCHTDGVNGFYERHTGSSDCTSCHFANTTRAFNENASLFSHDHNLTVEHNYYEYNQSGLPVRTNNGTGLGMFPYYTCTLTCHKYNATSGVEGKIDEAATSWLSSAHARSLHMSGDDQQSCARCKSPANYNASSNQSSLISQPDWQGIQCRVCHNLHDRKFPNNTGPGGFPVAFYNGTLSSLAGYAIYDKVNSSTELCEKCHSSSHDPKFEGTHKASVNFTCTNCHMNSSFNNELHKFEVRNTTSGITGCEVCHKASEHTVLLCKGKIDCVGCHDRTVQRNITGYAVSPDNNYGLYKDPISDNWTTYRVSHGFAVTWPSHNITSEVVCEKCHGSISVYSGLITPATGDFCERCHYQPPNGTSRYNTDGSHELHKEKGYSAPETSCDYCHSTGGRNETGHPNTFDNADVVTNDSVSIGIYVKNPATGSDDTCADVSCHNMNLSQGARVGNSTWNTSTAGRCNQCHSTQISGQPPTGNHTKHFSRNVSCSTCHGNNSDAGTQAGHRNGLIEINLTNLASGGNYVSGTCTVYCHSPNPNDVKPNPNPAWNSTTIVCGDCHSIPPTNFTTRNGNIHPHDALCEDCHGAGAGTGTHTGHRNGMIDTITLKNCLSCHEINGSAIAKVDSASFGMHRNANNTDGGITNDDCLVCHFNITGMFADYKPLPGINVYLCEDCHKNQTVNSTKVAEHIPGSNISVTTMNCEDCHVNSLNTPDPATTINSSLGKALHYGTVTSLVRPTAGTYNIACDNCHNNASNKTKYGAQDKQVYMPHTDTGKCNLCHIPESEADTLHNSSVSMPLTVSCLECHTRYATKYKASNITGTRMGFYSTCNINWNCHPIDEFTGSMDTLARHNVNVTVEGTGGYTDTVYLNDQVFLRVTKGSSVIVTSKVNDTGIFGGASRVGGAEYYIDNDPGQGKGIPMEAADGSYDALMENWENVTATLDTGNLSNGEHKIFVRGVDIGKQWSVPVSATLVIDSLGYINVSSNVPGSIIFINGESNATDTNGNYSWRITYGTYDVTIRKEPAYYDNTSTGIVVTASNTTNHNVILALKPNGTITGTVLNG